MWAADVSPRVRWEYYKTMGAYVSVLSASLYLFSLMAADDGDDDTFVVEYDPRSSDFGKVRIGSTRYDFGAGYNQVIVFFSRFITNERKSTTSGNITKLNEGIFGKGRSGLTVDFFRTKASPSLGALWNLGDGEDMLGRPVTVGGEALKQVTPFWIMDVAELIKADREAEIAANVIPALFGVGVQDYGDKSLPTDPDKIRELMLKRKEKYLEKQTKKEKSQAQIDYENKKEAEEDQLYKNAKKYKIEYYDP